MNFKKYDYFTISLSIQYTLNMNVDKFGHHIHKRMRLSELIEFNENALLKSENGDFDLKTSRLKGIRSPVDAHDAVNKDYVDRLNANTLKELNNLTVNKDYVDQLNANMLNKFNNLIGTLRSQIIKDAKGTVQTTLKAKIPEVSTHLQDKFYTKAEVDKLLQKTP